MFFEPIQKIVDTHGERLHGCMDSIRDTMIRVAEGIEAQLARNWWTSKSVEILEGETGQLRNDSAYGWLIRDSASTVGVEIFLNSPTGNGFLCKLAANERENVHWYVPPGSLVLVKNLAKATGFVNFQVEVLVTPALPAQTGRTLERMDSPRIHTVPSGHALDEQPLEEVV